MSVYKEGDMNGLSVIIASVYEGENEWFTRVIIVFIHKEGGNEWFIA